MSATATYGDAELYHSVVGDVDDAIPGSPPLDDPVADFAQARSRLFGIAYRMLGSWTEAEDLIQDVWLRWHGYDRSTVVNPTAFLVTTTTRLAINAAQSARARRETYVGEWLPEPVDTSSDPTLGAERNEALELGMLILLERLSATERAAYVLRHAFDYPYEQIARMLHLTEANARQVVSRASKHMARERTEPVDKAEQDRLLHAFVDAARGGDLHMLEALLTDDVVSLSDGGGVVRAARFPVVGRPSRRPPVQRTGAPAREVRAGPPRRRTPASTARARHRR